MFKMTKRCGSYQSSNGKKPKLDEDDVWDDVADEVLDRVFEIATQEEFNYTQSKETSILPTYNAFKSTTAFSSSTQANISTLPSTSKKPSLFELEAEIQRLKVQNEEKDGEILILRSKIKETNSVVQVEQQKTISEWREKLLSTQREANVIKSDLEFKNLQIANLKQQLSELRRQNLDVSLNSTQQFVVPEPVVKVKPERPTTSAQKEPNKKSSHREAILESTYPLKHISPNSFEEIEENHVIKNTSSYKISRNTIPYLQNQQTYNELSFHHKCARIGNNKISLKCVYPDVFKLVNSTSEQINSVDSVEAINKIICVAIIMVQDLNEFLVEFGLHLRTEDIQQADTNYLLDDRDAGSSYTIKVSENELGRQAGKILEVLSQIILYNKYAADFVCSDKTLKLLPNTREYVKLIPHRNGSIQNDCYLLKLLLNIVKHIGKYRIATQMNGFLMSVVNLLISIGKLDDEKYSDDLMTKTDLYCILFKEIVFARPGTSVMQRITCLLKISSHYKPFVQYLFRKDGKHPLKTDPKGVLYYNEVACPFCVVDILLQNFSSRNEKLPLDVYYNILAFIYNTFKTSHWIHHESADNVCVCLSQLYKLEMDFVFKALEDFVEYFGEQRKNCGISDEWKTFFRHEIVQKVLNQLNFNNFELTEKDVMVYSKFKEIEKVLTDEGLFNITQLNTSDVLINIPKDKFKDDF